MLIKPVRNGLIPVTVLIIPFIGLMGLFAIKEPSYIISCLMLCSVYIFLAAYLLTTSLTLYQDKITFQSISGTKSIEFRSIEQIDVKVKSSMYGVYCMLNMSCTRKSPVHLNISPYGYKGAADILSKIKQENPEVKLNEAAVLIMEGQTGSIKKKMTVIRIIIILIHLFAYFSLLKIITFGI